MKVLAAVLFVFSSSAFAWDLAGKWVNTEDGTVVNFMRIGGNFHQHSTAQYNYPNGLPAYTISQSIIAPATYENTIRGTVDFFDSRGCSFRGFPVVIELVDNLTANVLMTVPRYQSRGCQLIENVEVPVELKRL